MLPKYHLITSLVILLFYPFFNEGVFVISIANLLVDLDHYPFYVYLFKKRSIKKAYEIIKEKRNKLIYQDMLYVFHTFEFSFILILNALNSEFFMLVAIGVMIHMVTDFADVIKNNRYKSRTLSVISWFLRNKISKLKEV